LTQDELDGLDRYEEYPFSPRERAALRLAERLSLYSKDGVDDALMHDLQEAFSDAEVIELAMVIAILVGMAKMLFAFNFVEKEAYCPL
jgi:alkylhydroperoxidase family enzyme